MTLKTAQKIVVLATGGTIAGLSTGADPSRYQAAQVPIDALLSRSQLSLAELAPGCRLQTEQVAQIDSKSMSHAIWAELATRCAAHLADPEVLGLVITHGTDTVEETAFFLQSVLRPRKPVVMTCAMLPANAPEPDGPGNLRDALRWLVHAAQTPERPSSAQTVVVLAGEVHAAHRIQKVTAQSLQAFASGPAGPVARVASGHVQVMDDTPAPVWAAPSVDMLPPAATWPEVRVVMSHAQADGREVRVLSQSSAPPAGWVAAATGAGSIHVQLEQALREAEQRGARILRATRCVWGRADSDDGRPFEAAGGLNPVKARIALLLELMA